MTALTEHAALLAWLDEHDARYEVLDGQVLVSPPDRPEHSSRGLRVAAALIGALPEGLEVYGPSYPVHVAPGSFVLPDVLVARPSDCASDGTRVAPLLVVEVLSPSTRRRDRGEKRELYAELGVPHYWLVDPERHAAAVLRLGPGGYDEVLTAVGELRVDEPFPAVVPL